MTPQFLLFLMCLGAVLLFCLGQTIAAWIVTTLALLYLGAIVATFVAVVCLGFWLIRKVMRG